VRAFLDAPPLGKRGQFFDRAARGTLGVHPLANVDDDTDEADDLAAVEPVRRVVELGFARLARRRAKHPLEDLPLTG
jgi:hypothetical protein